ncbi:MAG: carbon-nitrogen hydrolase family protein [Pseudomonadota bacterium]
MSAAAQAARIAVVQMTSGPEVADNLAQAGQLLAQAAAEGAQLAALPENFALMGRRDTDKIAVREEPGRGPIQAFLAETAARLGLWVLAGSVPLATNRPDRVRASLLLYDAAGRLHARYDKIHLFGFRRGEERYDESATIEPGDKPTAVDTPFGRAGLSICYDVRFPELYRALGPLDLIFIPSAFTATTGRAHWETLVRARAIENLAYAVAPAQAGEHPGGRRTHGHSLIVDPWGEVLAEIAEAPGVAVADIDPLRTAAVRASLPALEHRTLRRC